MRFSRVRQCLAPTLLLSSVAGCGSVENAPPDAVVTSDAQVTPDSSPDAPSADASPNVQAPVNATTAGTVAEAGTLSLAGNLVSADADTGPGALVYTVQALPATGSLRKDGTPLTVGGTFTQQEITDGRVAYTHDGAENAADSFTWSLSDGVHTIPAAGATTFAITVTPVNDAPTIINNPVSTVAEGGIEVLTPARLQAADAEGGALTFTFLGISRGQLQKNNVALATNGTFTQADIAAGTVRFVDPGTDDANLAAKMATSATFQWRVADPQGGMNPAAGSNVSTFTISPVDDPAVVVWRTQRCAASGTNVLANPLTSLTDPDNAASEYSVCVVSISDGSSYVQQGSTTVTTVTVTITPVLQNVSTNLAVGSCVPASQVGNLNLDSSANQHRGAVTFRLMLGTTQIGANQTVQFPVTPTSC